MPASHLRVSGFQVHSLPGWTEEEWDTLEEALRRLRGDPIFGRDKRRLQSRSLCARRTMAAEAWRLLERLRAQLAETVAPPRLEVSAPVALESRAGCARQPAHSDYTPASLRAADLPPTHPPPCGCLVAVERSGTRLEVWPGVFSTTSELRHAHAPPRARVSLALERGQAVVFRGDLVHGGSAYPDASNVRLHYFMDHPALPRAANRTWVVSKHGGPALRRRVKGD